MGQLMKDVITQVNGRGGGSADLAQGGLPADRADDAILKSLLQETARKL
jgi:alanyl-tRNA synthetase